VHRITNNVILQKLMKLVKPFVGNQQVDHQLVNIVVHGEVILVQRAQILHQDREDIAKWEILWERKEKKKVAKVSVCIIELRQKKGIAALCSHSCLKRPSCTCSPDQSQPSPWDSPSPGLQILIHRRKPLTAWNEQSDFFL